MSVLLDPDPATTGTRPLATLTTVRITRRSSSSVMAGVSPVVPQGTRPWMPPWIWNSTMPSSASTSTSPFRNGVTRAVNAPLNISLLQLEIPVQNSNRFFYSACRQYASHLYLGGRDEPYGDARLPERREHPRRVAGTVEHPRPDDGDLAQLLLALNPPAQRFCYLSGEPQGCGEVAATDGEGNVRSTFLRGALHDNVDGDARLGQGREDAAHRTRARLYAREGDARDVEVVHDTGDRLARLEVFQAVTSRDDRTCPLHKGALYVDLDPVQCPKLHGPRVHHPRAPPRHLGHLRGEYDGNAPRLRDDARVGGVDAVYVRKDLTAFGPERRRERHGRRVRPAASERHDVPKGVDPLKARDDGDLSLVEQAPQAVRLNPRDYPGAVAACDLHAGLQARQRGGGDAPVVQRHSQERDGLKFSRREKLVDLTRRRVAADLPGEPEQPVGLLAHRRDGHDEAEPGIVGPLYPLGDGVYVLRRRHRAPAVFLDDDPQKRYLPMLPRLLA